RGRGVECVFAEEPCPAIALNIFSEEQNRMIHSRGISVSAIFAYALLTHVCSVPLIADESRPDIPRHGKAIVLFDGTNLDSFDSFLKTKGLNNDPDHVFRLENKTIHISG